MGKVAATVSRRKLTSKALARRDGGSLLGCLRRRLLCGWHLCLCFVFCCVCNKGEGFPSGPLCCLFCCYDWCFLCDLLQGVGLRCYVASVLLLGVDSGRIREWFSHFSRFVWCCLELGYCEGEGLCGHCEDH